MKKILSLMALFIILGCDDGDMTFQTFDFSEVQIRSCNNDSGTIYKVNGSEALVLKLAEQNFANVETGDIPRIVTVGGANTVQYLKYASDIGSNPDAIICSSLPPLSASEVWNANGGTISIETFPKYEDDENPTLITGYTHTIELVSVSFSRNEETIIIQNNVFGDYNTDLPYEFIFNGTGVQIQRCETVNSDRLYITRQDEVLRMDIDVNALFQNEATETPRVQSLTGNEIVLYVYSNSSILQSQICNPGGDDTPDSPYPTDRWRAISGSVEVTTISLIPGTYEHTIKLVNITFQNTQNSEDTFTRESYILPVYTVVE